MSGFEKMPHALLDDVSVSLAARAVYAVLLKVAWQRGARVGEEVELPNLRALSASAGCSQNALKGYIGELRETGWVATIRGARGNPQRYILRGAESGPPGTGREPDPDVNVGQNMAHSRARGGSSRQGEGPDTPPIAPPAPKTVDRVPVTDREASLSSLVLESWNAQAGQRLASSDWLAKIVMRIREHPDLALPDHANVIASALADPWWSGPATPSVVYGNGAQFERCLVKATSGEPGRSRGLTAEEAAAFEP